MLRFVALLAVVASVSAYNNGLGKTPPLGWNTWCAVGQCGQDLCTDTQIMQTVDAMIANGMQQVGYEWVNLDDCWHPTRNSTGYLVPLVSSFPNGLVPVIDYVHSKGFKFGLYTSAGNTTCRGNAGSYGHFTQDAETFASWGVDYVKMDWCGSDLTEDDHKEFSAALNKTGRHIWLELCRGTYQVEPHYGYAASVAQSFRSGGDHHDNWPSTLYEIGTVTGKSDWYGPYGWAYLDFLMTGGQGCGSPRTTVVGPHCPGQTDGQYRTEFSVYAIVASPLIVATDVRNFTSIMQQVLLNTEIIAVNQDSSKPGGELHSCGARAWARKLSNGNVAVVLPNLSDKPASMSVCFMDVGFGVGKANVRDLWKHASVGSATDKYTTTIAANDVLFVVLSKA